MRKSLGSFVALNRRAFVLLGVLLSVAVLGVIAWQASAQEKKAAALEEAAASDLTSRKAAGNTTADNDAGILTTYFTQIDSPEAICNTFTYSVVAGDPTMSTRPFRDGVVKTCAAPGGPCQAGVAGTFHYQIFQFTSPVAQCATVTYNATNANFSFLTVFNAPPNLANLCTNWVTDAGSSATQGTPIIFSFNALAGTTYYFLVNDVGTLPANGTIQVDAAICAGSSANLGITKTDGVTTVNPGQGITYTIVASNAGPSAVTGATVTDNFPSPALTGVNWTCVGAGGGTCPAGGAGNINALVNLPVGGTATFTATATVSPGATFGFSNTATVAPPMGTTDPVPGNNSARDTDAVCPLPVFTNSGIIAIPATGTTSGISNPYPSNIAVAGLSGTVTNVTVNLNGLNHTFPDDIDILLVGPAGQNAIIMSDVGTLNDVVNVNLTLDDAAATNLPDAGQIVSGTFRPTNIGAGDAFAAPAPAPLGGTPLSIFNGTAPNGTWSLYIVDDLGGDIGNMSGGWSLTITTSGGGCPTTAAGVTVSGRVTTPDGYGLRNAIVTITDSTGMARTARTSSFGYYSFEGIEVGGTYVISVGSKRYSFTPRTLTVNDAVSDFDFTADGPSQ
jgi:uncharacterized repeat protein (TIGR01451 family)